jgi:regulator of sirC expression with transglutaminase-like and TPR domain
MVQKNKRMEPLNQEEKEKVQDLLQSLYLNLAQVALKKKQYSKTVDYASHVIRLNPSHPKALYRRSLAHLNRGDVDSSRRDFQDLLKHSSYDDKDIQHLEKCIQKEERIQIEKERSCYQKMFLD